MDRPPCWPEGQPCPNNCAYQLAERTIYNLTPLYGQWAGWRMAGRVLVSPDGDRISPERLRGILFREAGHLRLQKLRRKKLPRSSQVISLPARESFEGCA